jgi:hypothetical protein
VPVVQPAAKSAAAAMPAIVPFGEIHNCVALTDDDPVDTDEDDDVEMELAAEAARVLDTSVLGGGSSSDGTSDEIHDSTAHALISQCDALCASRGEPGGADDEGASATVRSLLVCAVEANRDAVMNAGYQFPEAGAPLVADGDPLLGVRDPPAPAPRKILPPGKMLVRGSDGSFSEVWISRVLCLLTVNSRLSTDRLVRITAAARAASARGLQASSLAQMVECGATCAVRYSDRLYYGAIARYGYYTPKSGLTSELTVPVSIHPDHKPKNISFWFVWFWPEDAPAAHTQVQVASGASSTGTGSSESGVPALVAPEASAQPRFIKSHRDTLHTGTFAALYVLSSCTHCSIFVCKTAKTSKLCLVAVPIESVMMTVRVARAPVEDGDGDVKYYVVNEEDRAAAEQAYAELSRAPVSKPAGVAVAPPVAADLYAGHSERVVLNRGPNKRVATSITRRAAPCASSE